MYLKLFSLTSLFLLTLSLNANDLNATTTIIENATKATTQLQTQFSELMKDEKSQKENMTVIKDENLSSSPTTELTEESVIEGPKEVIIEENITKETLPTEITEVNQTEITTLSIEETITSDANISSQVSTVQDELVETIETNSSEPTEEENEESEGSFTKGMIIFKTKIKANCEMTGDEFAKHYSQEDWDDIYDGNEFKNIVLKICPKMEGKYDDKWTDDLYQFSLKYANDSDEIPEC